MASNSISKGGRDTGSSGKMTVPDSMRGGTVVKLRTQEEIGGKLGETPNDRK